MPSLLLTNARVVLETKTLSKGYVFVQDGFIREIGEGDAPQELLCFPAQDCGGGTLCPGFIDLHVHGGGDSDFMDGTAEDVVRAARAHLRHGTTTIAPTSLTCPDEELFVFFDCYREAQRETKDMPRLAGIHLEGPYFSPEQAGAQPPHLLVHPQKEAYREILRQGDGLIIRWSSAPELPGALELGDELRERGIIASIGHSNATYEEVKAAIAHGYTHVTHLYSGMSTIVRRRGMRVLGVVECAYLFDELDVEIIADGIHLPPELLRLIVKTMDERRLSLITDGMRGAGMPEGPSILGSRKNGQPVIIRGGIANMPDFTGFAGSVATTDRLVRTMVQKAGLPIEAACRMMSLHPAKLLRREDELGSIAVGKRADLVLMDEGLHASRVFVGGEEAFQE